MSVDILKAGMNYVISCVGEIIGCDAKSAHIKPGMFGYTHVEFCKEYGFEFGIRLVRVDGEAWSINVNRHGEFLIIYVNELGDHNVVIDKLKAWMGMM
jgi:hypothetical protein